MLKKHVSDCPKIWETDYSGENSWWHGNTICNLLGGVWWHETGGSLIGHKPVSGSPVAAHRVVSVYEWVSATERERETWSEKESNRKRTRTNRELHSGPIHRHIIQSDMTIRLCDPSIHIGPRQPVTDASFTPTQRHTSTLPLGLHCYQAFISLQQILLRVPTHIHSQFPPPWHEHIAKIFYGAYSCKRTATKLLWASFTAKVGVRVYPLASHNIDKAVLSGSKPQPSSRNTGRQTGGCMSIWGAYRQIKDAASIPIGRPWWTTRREKGKQTGREGMRMSTAKCSES